MKLSAQLARLRHQKQRKREATGSDPRRSPTGAGRRWAWLVVGLLLAGGATWAVCEWVIWNRVPAALVGTWEVQEGPMAGGTFEFARDGALVSRLQQQGGEITLHGSVEVDGQVLWTTTHNAVSRQDETHRLRIRTLTDSALVLELEKGAVLKMARRR